MVIDAPLTSGTARFGPFQLSVGQRLLEKDGAEVRLGGRALDILVALIAQPGEVIATAELTQRVWGDVTVAENSLRVHITSLRKALGDGQDDARYITNIAGRGYCFVAPVVWNTSNTSAAAATAEHTKLPPPLKRMTGRDAVVESLVTQLTASRFVSIVGTGGIGKTTVAVACAHAMADSFGGAYFIDLGSLKDGSLVAATVASSLGVVAPAGNALGPIAAYLRDKQVLLVFDNCEHVIETTAALVEHLYYEAPGVHLLTTSREALRVDGEHVYLLPSLQTPPEQPGLTTAEIVSYPAVRLFLERAAASGGHVALDDDQAAIVADICQRLDGVALAIELAAGFVGAYGIPGTARLLANRFKLLRQPGRRTAPPRQQTLNAMIDWSYATLSEREQRVMRRLSIFMGTFTAEAAVAVVVDADDSAETIELAIDNLIAKCLLSTVVIDGVALYRVLDTTRAYGQERLEQTGEKPAISRAHAWYFTELFEREQQINADFFNANVSAQYALHLGNVRAALEWAFSGTPDIEFATRLTAAVTRVFLAQSLLVEGYYWTYRAVKLLDDSRRGGTRELVLLEGMAISLMFTRGNTPEVQAAIDRALELATTLADDSAQLHLLAGLHIFSVRTASFHQSMRIGERSCEIAERMGKDNALVGADLRRGVGLHLAGYQTDAQRYFESGFRRAERMSDASFIFFAFDHKVTALTFLCRVLWLRGLPDQAADMAQKAITEAARREHPVDVCISLMYTGSMFLWRQDWDQAESIIDRLQAYGQRHSLAPYLAVAQALRGEWVIQTGDATAGVEMLRDAIERMRRENHTILVSMFCGALASGYARIGQVARALVTIDAALEEAQARQVSYEMPELLRLRATFLLQQAPLDPQGAAEAALRRAVDLALEGGAVVWALRAAMPLADRLATTGRGEDARAMLSEALAACDGAERIRERIDAEAQLSALG